MLRGVDVSENNGIVDWGRVALGLDFAIIRIGYGRNHLDSQFYNNINGALTAGLKIGIYHYSYALLPERAQEEARFVVETLADCGLSPEKLEMGIWFDMEDADGYKQRHGMPSRQEITAMCSEFICECNRSGYSCGIYASLDWLEHQIATEQLASYVPYWVAQWGGRCDWPNASMWQYTDGYYVDGKEFDGTLYFD